MVNNRNALALLVALGIALGVVGLLLSGTGPVAAQTNPSATRSLSATTVAPGAEVTATISVSGASTYQIVETLPEGFSFTRSSLRSELVKDEGQVVRFTFMGG